MTNYRKRICIPCDRGDESTIFTTKNDLEIAHGYRRIVIGERGPYIEFSPRHIITTSIIIPPGEQWRVDNDACYYVEFRSTDKANVMIYLQKRPVKYADYEKGLFYISPFDLYVNGKRLIEPIKTGKKKPCKREGSNPSFSLL